MMEVEAATKPLLFKEEVDIMEEEEEDSGAALQTRKRLHHGEGTNGDLEEVLEEHKSVFFDPTKGLWKCRHCDWTYRLSSSPKNGTLNHRGFRHQIEWNRELLESFYGSPNKVPDLVAEVSARYLVTEAMESDAQNEDTSESLSPKGKELEAHGNVNAQEIDYSPRSNGKLENGSHSNGSHEVSNGSETKIAYMSTIDKTNNLRISDGRMGTTNGDETEVDKDKKHVTEDNLNIQEYDLEKIIDEQETHDLFCPNCNSCITRRVILRKRKRTVRQATRAKPTKEARITEPSPCDSTRTVPEGPEHESPDVFRCLSCFSFFIPAGCNFNIFRIFGRPEVSQEVQGPHPSASVEMPQSENCGSWILSCFQSGDSPRKADADPARTTQFSGAQSSTITSVAASSSTVDGHGTVAKPEESKEQLPDESSSQSHTTITTTTTTMSETASTSSHTSSKTTSVAASTSSHTSSATGIFHTEVMEVITGQHVTVNGQIPPLNPAGEAVTDASHIPEKKDFQSIATTAFENGSFPNPAMRPRQIPTDEPASPDHLALPISDAPVIENPPPPTSEQRDEWDILKAIIYGGLVESITSLSIVSAAAASGAKTLDIFVLGIANLIGGIPLIFHNIHDLRNLGDVGEDDEQVGHYWLQLGRRSKFQLHMVLALISYILFGLLPPVIYGLSFRESDNRENKMMAVAAASLFCIALLAIGKAHVKRPRTHFKTLMYYLTIAVSTSGLSYVAGVLITSLLVHFGLIDQGASPAAPAPPSLSFPNAAGAGTSAWASF